MSLSRRHFLEGSLSSLMTLAFLDAVVAGNAAEPAITPILETWLRRLHEHSADLRGGAIPRLAWQREVQVLLEQVPVDDLVAHIQLDEMIRTAVLPDDRATTRDPVFPPLAGLAPIESYIRRVFLMQKGRAIVPHGHRNMVSGHLVIHGGVHVRHYERLGDEPGYMIVKPTIDRASRPGMATTVSDEKDNVHWLTATTDVACTFDVIVVDLDPSRPTQFMDFVDPRAAEPHEGGTLRAPRLDADEVFRRYGKTAH